MAVNPDAPEEPIKASELGNNMGYRCPKCKAGDNIYIAATVTAALLPEGCDTSDSDTEWAGESPAWCGCGWEGKVYQLLTEEVDDDN